MKVQKEVDETIVIFSKSIESILQRAEMLDQPVEHGDEPLSVQSGMFYKAAKKQV
jgi:hypothetical protein